MGVMEKIPVLAVAFRLHRLQPYPSQFAPFPSRRHLNRMNHPALTREQHTWRVILNHDHLGNFIFENGQWRRDADESFAKQQIFDRFSAADRQQAGLDLSLIPEPIRSLVCYLGADQVVNRARVISIV
jgi:hypothetical protein